MAAESFLVRALSTLVDDFNLQDQADLEKIRARQDELHVDWSHVEGWKIKLGLSG